MADFHSVFSSDIRSALVSSIVSDLSSDAFNIQPKYLVVCGDLINGSKNEDHKTALKEIRTQYNYTKEFLNELCEQIFDGDKNKIVIIPGNHDVTWTYSKQSMIEIDYDPDHKNYLNKPSYMIRWNWDDRSFYQINDIKVYNKRFYHFKKFYRNFYDNTKNYSLNPSEQFDIFEFEEDKIVFVGLNSSYYNDHLNYVGSINPICITNCHDVIRKEQYKDWLKIGVWHHGTYGHPYQVDYMHEGVINYLISKDIIFGLHGHKHNTEFYSEKIGITENKKMSVFCCGSLSADLYRMPRGNRNQYSVIEIDVSQNKVRLHVREAIDQPDNMPVWASHNLLTSSSYIEIEILKKMESAMEQREDQFERILKVDALVSSGDYQLALEILNQLEMNSIVRKYKTTCLVNLQRDEGIVELLVVPYNVTEFTYLTNSLWKLKRYPVLDEIIEKYEGDPEIGNSDAYRRMKGKMEDRRNE